MYSFNTLMEKIYILCNILISVSCMMVMNTLSTLSAWMYSQIAKKCNLE